MATGAALAAILRDAAQDARLLRMTTVYAETRYFIESITHCENDFFTGVE